MQPAKMPPSQETIDIAENVLSDAFGGPVHLGKGETLQGGIRMQVYRFLVMDAPDNAPASVIVKQVKATEQAPYLPDRATMPAWTLFNEWASLQFLHEVAYDKAFAPRFYGGNRMVGLIALEDLGSGVRLDQLLLGNNADAAESALIEYASIHGRMHAATIGQQSAFQSLRNALGPSVLEDGRYIYDWLAPTLFQAFDLLGLTHTPKVERELVMLKEALLHPGPFHTFIQGDSCPDNCLFVGSTLRLLDFEGGKFDHALQEGVYGRMRFPTCWCVYQLPANIPLRMEAAYRAELMKGCPEAGDDTLFYRAVTDACVFWLIDWCQMVPLSKIMEQDRHLIAATDRQRYLARCDVVAQTTAQYGHLEATGAAIQAMAQKMRRLWPDVEEMPLYPAWR